jgi:hypothetical protein
VGVGDFEADIRDGHEDEFFLEESSEFSEEEDP